MYTDKSTKTMILKVNSYDLEEIRWLRVVTTTHAGGDVSLASGPLSE